LRRNREAFGLLVVHVRSTLPAPVRAPRTCSPLPRKEQPLCPTLRPLDAPFGSPRRRPEDASSPTSATDPSIRAPDDRSTPEPAARAAATASTQLVRGINPERLREHGVGPPFGNPAPGKAALDGATPASARCFTFPPLNEGEIGPRPEAAATQARRSQPRLKRKIRPLTLLSPPLVTRKTRAPFGDLGRFHRPRVNKCGFPGPKRLSSTCASPTFAGIARHRSLGFAASVRLPALVRPSDALARKG
jgi:hypothetical protein